MGGTIGAERSGRGAADSGVTVRVGRLLQARRVRARLTQGVLADRAGKTQQWVSRVERGEVDLRLSDVETLLAATGARLVVQAASGAAAADDPDLVAEADMLGELEAFAGLYAYVWRRFAAVPYFVGGRLAALAQGLPVRPQWVDLLVAEPDLAAANAAMTWLNATRWSDVNQDYTIYDLDLEAAFPRRFLMRSGLQLRIDVVPEAPPGIGVRVGELILRVVPLVRLVADDADVSELAGRLAGVELDRTKPDG
jgi:transcriptional regulator with XRE-family HTH domain